MKRRLAMWVLVLAALCAFGGVSYSLRRVIDTQTDTIRELSGRVAALEGDVASMAEQRLSRE